MLYINSQNDFVIYKKKSVYIQICILGPMGLCPAIMTADAVYTRTPYINFTLHQVTIMLVHWTCHYIQPFLSFIHQWSNVLTFLARRSSARMPRQYSVLAEYHHADSLVTLEDISTSKDERIYQNQGLSTVIPWMPVCASIDLESVKY